MKSSRFAAFVLAALVLVAYTATPAIAQSKKDADLPDTIYLKAGGSKKADIQKLDPKGVIFNDARGKAQPVVAWDDITRIEYKDFPSDLGAAEAALERRDFNKAESGAEDAIKVCQDGKVKELFLARAQVAKARALRGLGRFPDAAQVADAALASANGNLYAKDASVEKVWALCEQGSADAIKATDDAEKLADVFGDEFKYDVYILIADYYYKQKNTDDAKKKFAYCKNSTRRELQDRAKLGLGYVKLLENDPDGASDLFKEILASSTDSAALAGASVGLGDATLAKIGSGTSDKPTAYREVLNIYLHGVVLAYPSGNSPTENHEASIRKAADVCALIAATVDAKDKSEKANTARKFYIDYQRKLYEELVKTYPNMNDAEQIHAKISKLKQDAQALTTPEKPAEK